MPTIKTMNTIRRTKTEITIETTKVTVIRNRGAAVDAVCEYCGQTVEPIEIKPEITRLADESRQISSSLATQKENATRGENNA